MPTSRLAYFDNLKLFLIFTVILGHFLFFFLDNNLIRFFFSYLYSFHLHLFIFISGLFSKNFHQASKLKPFLKKFIILYLIFSGINLVLAHTTNLVSTNQTSIIFPYTFLWFIPSFLTWRISLPILHKPLTHKPISSLVIITLISILLSAISDWHWPFALSHTIFYFPFFIAGYLTTPKKLIKNIKKLPLHFVLIFQLLSFFILYYLFTTQFEIINLLLTHYSTHDYPVTLIQVSLLYSTLPFIAAINSLTILKLTPQKSIHLTPNGSHTLTAYLLHYYPLTASILLFKLSNSSQPTLIILSGIIISATLTYILTLPKVTQITKI